MKKVTAVLAVVVMVVALVSLAFAGSDTQTITIKSVDATASTIVYTDADGKDVTMKVDKSVNLKKVKDGDKAKITVENDMVTTLKTRSKSAVGC